MFHITLHPVRQDAPLAAMVAGDTITLNGVSFDLSPLPEGGALPAGAMGSSWFVGAITREDGVLHVGLILPHGHDAPDETRFPAPLLVVADGPVPLPPHAAPEEPA